MVIAYSLALTAAFAWSLASLISVDIARKLGSIAFNRIRLIIVTIMLVSYTYFTKGWGSINVNFLGNLIFFK